MFASSREMFREIVLGSYQQDRSLALACPCTEGKRANA